MSRKRFFAVLAAVTAIVLLAAPAVATAVPTYRAQWDGSGGAGGAFVNPYGIAADGLGNVYIADYGNNQVQVYTGTGTHLTHWGGVNRPIGVAIGRALGRMVVAEYIGNTVKVRATDTGAVQFTVGTGTPGSGPGDLQGPGDVAFDRFGNVYVTDNGNNRVQRFSPSGSWMGEWGGLGAEPGRLSNPWGIAVDSAGFVYVCDFGNNRIQKFTSTGGFVTQWGAAGTADGSFNGPAGIHVGQDGNIYVSDYGNDRIQAFTPSGGFLFKFGASESLNGPWGLASDGSGIYVVDHLNSRVVKYSLSTAKQTIRVGGANRYDVADNLVSARWPGLVGIKHVIVVCGEDRANADPLAASGLAGVYDAPILMTKTAGATAGTLNLLKAIRAANGPIDIHVVGGTRSIPKAVYNKIATTNPGGFIERINGADRYELSANMAIRVKAVADSKQLPVPGVMIFNGQNSKAFYDALAAGPLSAGGQVPMLAVRNDSIPGPVLSALNTTFVGKPRWAISSTGYIPASVYNAAGCTFRFANTTDRSTAAWQIAFWGRVAGLVGLRNVSIANKLPDSLTGGAFIGEQGGILLYTDRNTVPQVTQNALAVVKVGSQQGWAFGGPASVSDAAIASFNTVLNTP